MRTVNLLIGLGLGLAGLYSFVRLFTTWRRRGKRKRIGYLLSSVGSALIAVQYVRYGLGNPIDLRLLVTGSVCIGLAAIAGGWAEWDKWSATRRTAGGPEHITRRPL